MSDESRRPDFRDLTPEKVAELNELIRTIRAEQAQQRKDGKGEQPSAPAVEDN